jgi:hypothetical protein
MGARNQITPVTPATPLRTVRIALFAAESVDRIGSKTKSYPQSQRSAVSGLTSSHFGHSFIRKTYLRICSTTRRFSSSPRPSSALFASRMPLRDRTPSRPLRRCDHRFRPCRKGSAFRRYVAAGFSLALPVRARFQPCRKSHSRDRLQPLRVSLSSLGGGDFSFS